MTRAALAVAIVLAWADPAGARVEKTVGWSQADVFPAVVRFLRVDEGVSIVEKDPDAGYVLFDLKEDRRTFRGAVELVRAARDGAGVRVVLRLDDRPEWEEIAMLERLERKLADELGRPPPPPPAKPAAPPPSAGTGQGTGSGS